MMNVPTTSDDACQWLQFHEQIKVAVATASGVRRAEIQAHIKIRYHDGHRRLQEHKATGGSSSSSSPSKTGALTITIGEIPQERSANKIRSNLQTSVKTRITSIKGFPPVTSAVVNTPKETHASFKSVLAAWQSLRPHTVAGRLLRAITGYGSRSCKCRGE